MRIFWKHKAKGMKSWLVGWLFNWLVGWLVGWMISWLTGWMVGLLTSSSFSSPLPSSSLSRAWLAWPKILHEKHWLVKNSGEKRNSTKREILPPARDRSVPPVQLCSFPEQPENKNIFFPAGNQLLRNCTERETRFVGQTHLSGRTDSSMLTTRHLAAGETGLWRRVTLITPPKGAPSP